MKNNRELKKKDKAEWNRRRNRIAIDIAITIIYKMKDMLMVGRLVSNR